MKSRPRYLVPIAILVALTQIGVLASMIMGRAAILRDGDEVVLEVLPVDPRDLLRGDYVRLEYNISSVPVALFEQLSQETGEFSSDEVYVRVRADDDGIWQPVAAGIGAPPGAARGEDEVDLLGRSWIYSLEHAEIIPVDYGIERFYLPEGEGRPIEENLRQREFRMVVAVGNAGTAQIKAFYDGETLIYREPLY